MLKVLSLMLFYVLLAGQVISQSIPVPAVNDQLYPSQSALLNGYVGEKLDASYQNRIVAQDVERLIAPFRNRTETSCWQSEFWGKWFTSAMLAYHYKPEPQLKKILGQAVEGLIATQTADGYIGNYTDDKHLAAWDIWGRKYCMLGLLSYYDLTRDPQSLKAAVKVADHLMKELKDRNALIVKQGNHRGMAASSVLEPICQLYSRTGDQKYMDFAQEIVRQWETPEGPQLISKASVNVADRFPKPQNNWYGWEQGQKAYEMMSCYEGLLELYRLTGKTEYKTAVEKTWESIRETEINVAGSGSAVECWFHGTEHQAHPVFHYQETCVTATWIKLSQQLLRLTGEAKYAEAIEQTYYNALLGSMSPDGSDWAKYTPLSGQRLEGGEQCHMGLNCCVASGPRGLFTFPLTTVMAAKEGLQVNFYASGTYALQTPGHQKVEIVQETDYPVNGKIRIRVLLNKPENMSVQLRIPQWSAQSSVAVNGQQVKSVNPGKNVNLQRVWKSGDVIDMAFDMRGRVVKQGGNPQNIAILRGPVLLSRDARMPEPSLESIITPVTDKNGYIELEPVATKNPEMWMAFKASFIPESYGEGGSEPVPVMLCDYASAGNSKEGHPHFKVWLPQLLDPRN
ncbi:MAG TPA: beta-L-arabinofuranosidase domain-containing protein [Prolixibacteraceae bacterium]|nr:beta-L-arabinofuranosidase domain-containing protein [Prolixibacteraceae bacterium]